MICFTWTEKGKRMPLDDPPREDGTVLVIELPGGKEVGKVFAEKPMVHPPGVWYRTHFATCTDPKAFTKPKPKRR